MPRFTTFIGLWLAMLAFAVSLFFTPCAQADELEKAQSELDGRVAQLQKITDAVNESGEKVEALNGEIGDLLDEIVEHQSMRADLQKRIGELSKTMYKSRDDLNVASIIANADSFSDMLSNFDVRQRVLQEYADLVAEQEQITSELEAAYQEVSDQKDEQLQKIAQLHAQKDELSKAVSELRDHVDELNAAEQAALDAAAEAEALAASLSDEEPPAQDAPEEDEGSVQGADEEDAGEGEDEGEDADEDAEASDDDAGSDELPAGWENGYASAYGGSSDDSIGSEDPTATGSEVDDYSMGVAVPLAWGPEDYYGRSVEITYGDTTVVATVTDCGDMNGGDRSLDLQPGVFKALGFDDCDEWGVREIEYRFL